MLQEKSIKIIILLLSILLIYQGCKKGGEVKDEFELKREQREKEWNVSGQEIMAKSEEGERVSAEVSFEKKGEEEISRERPRKLRIGVLGPETGELSDYGLKTMRGVQLAADEINASGGINGQPLEIFHYDTESGIAGTLKAAEEIILDDIAAVIGSPTGETTFSASKKFNDHQIIFMSAGTRRRLGDTGPYMFRNTLSDVDAANELIDYCINKLGMKNFAIVSSLNNDYSITITALLKRSVLNKGYNIVEDIFLWSDTTANISKDDTSIESQIEKIKTKNPDAVIYTGDYLEGLNLAKEMRRKGIKVPLIGGEDLATEDFLKVGRDDVLGTIVYSGFYADSQLPYVKNFVDSYRKKNGEYPDRIAALSYDALNMVAEAFRRAQSMRPTHLRDSLKKIKDFKGVTGVTSFNDSREVKKNAFILKAEKKDGRLKFVLQGGEV
ncbi:MAG: ABC transporter substrate-binding protein [Nitrospinota bacterium]